MKRTTGSKIGLGVIGFFTFIFLAYVIFQYFILGPSKDVGFVSTKEDIHYHPWITILYIHIIFGTLALVLGPLQFNNKLRQKKKNLHRNIGKIYVGSIFVAFIAGLYLAYYGTGGIMGVIGFYTLEFAWLITTLVGFLKIRKKDIKGHQEWMLRSYAVTLTFVSFRIWSIPAMVIEGKPGVLFGLTIIFSWVVNLLIAEWILVRKKKNLFRNDHH
jgi:uncharacterized membrane protein